MYYMYMYIVYMYNVYMYIAYFTLYVYHLLFQVICPNSVHTFSSNEQDLREIINKLENLLLVFLLNQIREDLLTYILISHVLLIQKISNLYSM